MFLLPKIMFCYKILTIKTPKTHVNENRTAELLIINFLLINAKNPNIKNPKWIKNIGKLNFKKSKLVSSLSSVCLISLASTSFCFSSRIPQSAKTTATAKLLGKNAAGKKLDPKLTQSFVQLPDFASLYFRTLPQGFRS